MKQLVCILSPRNRKINNIYIFHRVTADLIKSGFGVVTELTHVLGIATIFSSVEALK